MSSGGQSMENPEIQSSNRSSDQPKQSPDLREHIPDEPAETAQHRRVSSVESTTHMVVAGNRRKTQSQSQEHNET